MYNKYQILRKKGKLIVRVKKTRIKRKVKENTKRKWQFKHVNLPENVCVT